MVKKIFVVLGILILGLLGFAWTRPDTYRVERSATISAPAAAVFPLVDDFHRWIDWSPWEHLDPAMSRTFEGPESGVGSVYAWVGNDKVGEGRMTINESRPDSRVGITLEFLKPWEATSQTLFQFQETGGATNVVWTMDGTNNFVSKLMSVFMNMDEMIGKDFEAGLSTLKEVAESAPPPVAEDPAATADTTAAPADSTAAS